MVIPSILCSQCTDKYSWLVVYDNDSTLVECSNGDHPTYADFDLPRIARISWEPDGISMDRPNVLCVPVLFRRRFRGVNLDDNEIMELPTIHGLGWEIQDQDGHTSGTYTFLLEDGSIVTSSDRNAV